MPPRSGPGRRPGPLPGPVGRGRTAAAGAAVRGFPRGGPREGARPAGGISAASGGGPRPEAGGAGGSARGCGYGGCAAGRSCHAAENAEKPSADNRLSLAIAWPAAMPVASSRCIILSQNESRTSSFWAAHSAGRPKLPSATADGLG